MTFGFTAVPKTGCVDAGVEGDDPEQGQVGHQVDGQPEGCRKLKLVGRPHRTRAAGPHRVPPAISRLGRSCSQRCAGSSCSASARRFPLSGRTPRGSRGGSRARRTRGDSRAGCRRRRRGGGTRRVRCRRRLVQALEAEAVGLVEAVVVHLFERGLAVAAVVLVRRERRPLPGRVERLADEQALRGHRVGDHVVHLALPTRPAAVVHHDVAGFDERGRAPRAACSSPPTVAASASSVARVRGDVDRGRRAGGTRGGRLGEHVGAATRAVPSTSTSPASSTTAASMPSGAETVATRPASSTGRSSCTASPRYAEPSGRDRRHRQTTGAREMPAITNDAVRSTSPAGSSAVKRSSSASSMAEISMRASAAPRQKCGPKPSATSWFGSRPTSNCVGVRTELVLVAVGRRVEQQQRIAGRDLDAADLGVAGGGAHERDHRRGPAQHLLGRGVEQRAVVDEALPLIGALGERGDAAGDRVTCRLVARDQQLVEEHHELVVAERLAVDLGLGEHRDDVVARVAAPAPSWSRAGTRASRPGAARTLRAASRWRRGSRPPTTGRSGASRLRDAEELGDDPQRERDRERLDRVERPRRLDARDELVGPVAHPRRERAHPRRREPGLHELAVTRVLGRIGVHHRGRRRVLDADLEGEDPLARAEASRDRSRSRRRRRASSPPSSRGARSTRAALRAAAARSAGTGRRRRSPGSSSVAARCRARAVHFPPFHAQASPCQACPIGTPIDGATTPRPATTPRGRCQERAGRGGVEGAAEVEALREVAAAGVQRLVLGGALDALGDGHQPERVRDLHDRAHEQRARAAEDVAHERAVDLEQVDRELLEVGERRVAGAEVVDGEPDAERAEPRGARRSPRPGPSSGPSVISRISRAGSRPLRSSSDSTRRADAGRGAGAARR